MLRTLARAAIAATLLALGACAVTITDTPEVAPAQPSLARIAAPVADIPTDIRRTTIIVTDIDRSLKLYRDVLGLKVNYDAPITVKGPAFTQNGPPRPVRLVLLNGKDPWIGWIGLLQYTDDPKRPAPAAPAHLGPGSHVIVTAVADAKAACEGAAALEGIRMTAPLSVATYPGRDGGPPIQVLGCQLFDADGAYLELNQPVK